MTRSKILSFLAVLCFVVNLQSCGPSLWEQALVDFNNKIKSIKTVGIIPPDILMYQLSSGSMRELIDEWCETADKNFQYPWLTS